MTKDDEDYFFRKFYKGTPFEEKSGEKHLTFEYVPELCAEWPRWLNDFKQNVIQCGQENGFDWSGTKSIRLKMLKYEKDILNFLDSKPDVYIILGDVRRLKLKNKNYPDHQVTLFAGSALILSERITENWEIRIPSEYHDRDSTVIAAFIS